MSVRSKYCISLCLTALLLSGCGEGFVAIKGRDNDVFFPAVRLSYPLINREEHGLSDFAFELDVSRGRGSGVQTISAGETVSLHGTTFPGPADIQQVFNLDAASASFRFRTPRKIGRIFMEVVGGVLYTDLDLRLQTGAVSAEQDFRDGGATIGLGVGWRVSDDFILDIRYVTDYLPFNKNRMREMKSTDLTASYWLSPNVAITGGYRHWKYSIDTENGSDINDLVWQGFSGGMEFSF